MMGNSASKLYLHNSGQQSQQVGPDPMDNRPYAPRSLSEMGKEYWREYVKELEAAGMLYSIDLNVLKDLCRWESLKERAFGELPGPDKKLYLEYRKDGALSHVQTHAAFTNLRSIQATINTLREKLGLSLRDRSGLKLKKSSKANTPTTPRRKKVTGYKGKDF